MIQVILFSGFLGAGKTTLLGRLLPELTRNSRKTALLVNDFGKLPMDGALLSRYGVPVSEIAGGSIFCVCKQANLIDQLTRIAREQAPELLLIEASGLAEPTDTAALLQNSFLRETYALPEVITVVDAVNFPKLAPILRVLPMQVKIADVLILTKTDLAVDLEPVKAELRRLNPAAPLLCADATRLYGELSFDRPRGVAPDASLRLCATATPGFSVRNYRSSARLSREEWEKCLKNCGADLLRAKGVVYWTNGEIKRLEAVNGVWSWHDDIPEQVQNAAGESAVFFAMRGDRADDLTIG